VHVSAHRLRFNNTKLVHRDTHVIIVCVHAWLGLISKVRPHVPITEQWRKSDGKFGGRRQLLMVQNLKV